VGQSDEERLEERVEEKLGGSNRSAGSGI